MYKMSNYFTDSIDDPWLKLKNSLTDSETFVSFIEANKDSDLNTCFAVPFSLPDQKQTSLFSSLKKKLPYFVLYKVSFVNE